MTHQPKRRSKLIVAVVALPILALVVYGVLLWTEDIESSHTSGSEDVDVSSVCAGALESVMGDAESSGEIVSDRRSCSAPMLRMSDAAATAALYYTVPGDTRGNPHAFGDSCSKKFGLEKRSLSAEEICTKMSSSQAATNLHSYYSASGVDIAVLVDAVPLAAFDAERAATDVHDTVLRAAMASIDQI